MLLIFTCLNHRWSVIIANSLVVVVGIYKHATKQLQVRGIYEVQQCNFYVFRDSRAVAASGKVAGVTCIFMNARHGAVAHRPRPGWTALSDAALFPNYFSQTCYVFLWHCVIGLISHATANEPMIDVLFYFVTFLAHCASVSCIINEMKCQLEADWWFPIWPLLCPTFVSLTAFEVFNVKALWPITRTVQSHPRSKVNRKPIDSFLFDFYWPHCDICQYFKNIWPVILMTLN